MAKIRVATELLNNLLFCGELVSITEVTDFDKEGGVITFEIEGAIVPKVEQVMVEVQEHYKTVKFIPVKA